MNTAPKPAVTDSRTVAGKRRCLKCSRVRVPMPNGRTICLICEPDKEALLEAIQDEQCYELRQEIAKH